MIATVDQARQVAVTVFEAEAQENISLAVVIGEVWSVRGQFPRAQNSKKGGAVGPKLKNGQEPLTRIKKQDGIRIWCRGVSTLCSVFCQDGKSSGTPDVFCPRIVE